MELLFFGGIMRILLKPFEKELPTNDLSINLVNFGVQEKDPFQRLGPFIKPEYTLQYVTEGNGFFEIGGKHYKIKEGDMFCLFKNELLAYGADKKDPYTYYWVGIDGMNAKRLLELIGFSVENPVIHFADERIVSIFQKLKNALLENNFANLVKAEGHVYELISLLLSFKPQFLRPLETASERIVSLTIEYINRNYNDNITITEIAKQLGFCRNYLSVIFKKQMGVSPMEYLMNYRISRAQIMLAEKMSVTETAINCGFPSISNFSMQFKKIVGVTPYVYKKKAFWRN